MNHTLGVGREAGLGWRELRAVPVHLQNVPRHRFGFAMHLQLEPLRQQRLQHQANLMRTRRGRRLRLNVITFGLHPRRPARDLIVLNFICLLDQILKTALHAETVRTDSVGHARPVRVGGPYGRHVEYLTDKNAEKDRQFHIPIICQNKHMRAGLIMFVIAGVARSATVSGIVTDAQTHLPLQGVAIAANGAIIRTDIEGRYSLPVPPGAIYLAASRTGYFTPSSDAAPLSIGESETVQRNFELRPLLKIYGVVEDYDTGERIPGCHVFAMQRIYALGRAWHVPAGLITADTRSGKFEIRNLEPGDYVLEIVPEETAPLTSPDANPKPSKKFHGWSYYPDASRIEMAAPIKVTEAGDVPVTIRLRKREPRAISGTVTAPASFELLRYVGDETRTVATGTLSAAGPFRIAGLPEGEYLLTARGSNDTLAAIPITVGDHDITDLRVAPTPGQIVAGTVRMADSGAPLPPALRLGVIPDLPFRTTYTERRVKVTDGRFVVATGPAPYQARLSGLPDGYVAIGGPDYVIVKTGSLTGKIKDGEYMLLPGGTTLIGEFAIDLAPGKYQVAKLEGDEPKLIGNKEFLQAKAAATTTTIEIKTGETTTFQP